MLFPKSLTKEKEMGRKPNTRLQIIQLGARLFIEEGYTETTVGKIGRMLGLSTGNITFYFPTKDHLLAVLVDELIDFQNLLMEHATEEGQSSLLAYCLELTSIAAACEESEVVRDFYASTYSIPYTLDLIRSADTEKTRAVFGEFCPEKDDEWWRATENIVSGIEYATIMTREEDIPLPLQIERTLSTILTIYGVPEEIRKKKIEKVLAMDYRGLGRRILSEFREYIERVNEENLKNFARKRKNR
ncbi:MAG: TetR/AcrR family transcriptional regulator [Ruminococcaceae bacterium]|nr:TetR/AcrR family transcriptional regulator [Oscillospiraceae bacterium]